LLQRANANPSWPALAGLIRALGPAVVGGERVRHRQPGGVAGGAVHCRECRRLVARGPAGFAANAPPYCLACLARHPEATLGERLKAHRVAAGLTMAALAEQTGVPAPRIVEYESGREAPKWRAVRKLIGVLGSGLVDVE
jgi:DNA-binding XRE family transcriptional regulator